MQLPWRLKNLSKTRTSLLKVVLGHTVEFCITDQFTPARVAEFESAQVCRAIQPNTQKKKRIRRPKGSKWKLINEMGLAHDEAKYRRIIVRFHLSDLHWT